MSENNGSAWPNQAGQGASGPFQNQAGDSSAWNGYGQQQPQQQYPQSNGAPYYGQPQYGQGQYGNGGPYGPGGPGGPGAMGGPQKKFPWVPVIVGLIAVIAIVVGVLFATGVVGGSDDPDPTPTPSVTVAPQPTTPEPSPTITPTPEPSPDTTTATSSNTNGQNADGSVNVGQWKVELIEFQKDGEDQVAKTGETDIPELEDGRQWAAAKVKLTNIGDEAASPASEVGITLDTDSGEEIWEEFGFYGDESVRGLGEIQPGESVESWFYMDIPSDMESANGRFFDYLVPENVDTDITVK